MHTTSVLIKNRAPVNSAHLDLTKILGHECHVYITSWEDSFEAYSYTDNDIQCLNYYDMGLDNVLGLLNEKPIEVSVQDWFTTIPADLVEAVSQLPSHRLGLLKACHSSFHARELLLSTPILAWMLLHYIDSNEISPFPIHMFSMKQRDILSAMGLVGTKSSVKQLHKLHFSIADAHYITTLLKIFKIPKLVEAFRHFDIINFSILAVLDRHHWLASTPLLNAFNSIEDASRLKDNLSLLNDTLNMSTQLRLSGRKHIAGCKNLAQLKNLHDRLALSVNLAGIQRRMLLHDENGLALPIPAPPIPGTATIEAITTVEALAKEGSNMRHCVASYINNIQLGKYYVYHMHEPEAVTIGLSITNAGIVAIDQIKCVANQKPAQDTIAKVKAWLDSSLD